MSYPGVPGASGQKGERGNPGETEVNQQETTRKFSLLVFVWQVVLDFQDFLVGPETPVRLAALTFLDLLEIPGSLGWTETTVSLHLSFPFSFLSLSILTTSPLHSRFPRPSRPSRPTWSRHSPGRQRGLWAPRILRVPWQERRTWTSWRCGPPRQPWVQR